QPGVSRVDRAEHRRDNGGRMSHRAVGGGAIRPGVSPLRWGVRSLALGTFLLITPFRVGQVVGNSMWPTLRDGRRVLVDVWYYRLTGLHQGDLVVLRHGEENWVKRLVGLPGEQIALFYNVDGDIVGVQSLLPGHAPPPRTQVMTIPADRLYILGDN